MCCSRARDTVLGETGDPTELVMVDDCQDTHLTFAIEKAKVYLCVHSYFLISSLCIYMYCSLSSNSAAIHLVKVWIKN